MVTNHGLIADRLKMYERKYIFQTEESLHQTSYSVHCFLDKRGQWTFFTNYWLGYQTVGFIDITRFI